MLGLERVLCAATLLAAPMFTVRDNPAATGSAACPGAVCSAATGLDAAQYTGWVPVGQYADVTFELTFTDANDSVTALTTVCWTSDSNTGANGTGFEICSVGVAGGAGTRTCPYTETLTTGVAEQFTQTWTGLPHAYLNCLYTATGVPAAADTLLVGVRRRSP